MNENEFVRRVLGLPVTDTERAERITELFQTRAPDHPTRQRIEELLDRARQRRRDAQGLPKVKP